MTTDADRLTHRRRAFARAMLATAGVGDPALERAFAEVPRERFLGPPPWRVVHVRPGGHDGTTSDPADVYADVLVALDARQGLNNGGPSLHALLLHALEPAPGERILHVGAGGGYYTAMLAALVGAEGRVVAVEIDQHLAALARANLSHRRNVTVVEGDGAAWPTGEVDGIYVNAAVGAPAAAWIERLAVGGRLVFPLGIPAGTGTAGWGGSAAHGAAFLVTRCRQGFAARWLSSVAFVHAEGVLARPGSARALARAFEQGGQEKVRSLRWRQPADPADCWFADQGWSLCFGAPTGP